MSGPLMWATVVILAVDLVFVTSYVLNFRWYCDALGVSQAVRPWWARAVTTSNTHKGVAK